MQDMSERGKCNEIVKCFEDAYKCERALIILDNVERLLGELLLMPCVRLRALEHAWDLPVPGCIRPCSSCTWHCLVCLACC